MRHDRLSTFVVCLSLAGISAGTTRATAQEPNSMVRIERALNELRQNGEKVAQKLELALKQGEEKLAAELREKMAQVKEKLHQTELAMVKEREKAERPSESAARTGDQKVARPNVAKFEHLREAERHLREAGFNDLADLVIKRARQWRQEQAADASKTSEENPRRKAVESARKAEEGAKTAARDQDVREKVRRAFVEEKAKAAADEAQDRVAHARAFAAKAAEQARAEANSQRERARAQAVEARDRAAEAEARVERERREAVRELTSQMREKADAERAEAIAVAKEAATRLEARRKSATDERDASRAKADPRTKLDRSTPEGKVNPERIGRAIGEIRNEVNQIKEEVAQLKREIERFKRAQK